MDASKATATDFKVQEGSDMKVSRASSAIAEEDARDAGDAQGERESDNS